MFTRQIAWNTGVQIIGKIISTLLGLLAIGILTRYLGIEKFGWYITTISFLGFVGIITDFGLIPVTAQMMSEPKFDKKELFKNLITFRLFTSIIFFGLIPFITIFLPYQKEIKFAIIISIISFISIALNQVLTGFLQNKLKMHIQAIGEITGRIVLVLGLWLLIAKQAEFLPIMGIIALSSLAYTFVILIYANKEIKISLKFDKEIWLAIIKKSWPIAISIIFNVIYLKGDTLLLSFFREQNEVGIYGAAYRVIDILAQTAMMLMGIMLPILTFYWSRGQKEEFKKQYQQAFDAMMLLAVPVTIGLIFTANKIMLLVAGNEFVESGKILQILAIAIFGVFLGAIFGHTAVAVNRQKQTMWIYISDAIITLIGYLIFIPKFGIYGAAWMTVFSEFYAGILLFIVIQNYLKEKLKIKTLGKIILASLIMGLTIYFLNIHIILLVLVACFVYATILLAIGGISRQTIMEILPVKKRMDV